MIKSLFFTLSLLVNFQILTAQSTKVGQLVHDGVNRDYRIYLPSNHDATTSLPLVINMHGYTSNATQQELYSGMNTTAEKEKFAVCYPNGINNAWNVGWAFGSNADDIGFLSTLIDELHSLYHIDLKRVYACGMSNGGFMSYRLACELPNKIAAIASVTGSMTQQALSSCTPGKAVPVMEIHGNADPIVNYNGTWPISVSINEVLKKWQTNNECNALPIVENVPNINNQDNASAEKWTYTNCQNDKKIIHIKVLNGGHTWPGSAISTGTTCQDFNASDEIWNFFKEYSLGSSISTVSNQITSKDFTATQLGDKLKLSGNHEFSFQIINLWGHILFKGHSVNSDIELDISSWTNGIYFIYLTNNKNDISSHKFYKN